MSIGDVTLEEVIEADPGGAGQRPGRCEAPRWDDLEREAFAQMRRLATSPAGRARDRGGRDADGRRRESELIRRAIAAYFHAGKFQTLLDLDGVTDIMVNAHDAIWLQHVDGRVERHHEPRLRRRRRPACRGRPPRPSSRRHRAAVRRRQADARPAPARRLAAGRDHERVAGAAGRDPPQRAPRCHARRARAARHDRPGDALAAGRGDGRRDARRRVRGDGRREDDAAAGDDQRAAGRTRASSSSRTPASSTSPPTRRERRPSSSGRPARRTSRASARSPSASSSAMPCGSTRAG